MSRLLAFALLIPAATPQPTPADYTTCQIVPNGPVERPDHYSTHPMRGAVNGAAPVSDLA